MEDIFFNILGISISMTPVIIIVIAFNPLLGKIYKSGWKYWLWLGISIRLVLPFSPAGKIYNFIELPPGANMISMARKNMPLERDLANAVSFSSSSFNMMETVAVIYFAGAVIFMMYKLINYMIFRKNIEKHCGKATEEIMETACDVGKIYGINLKRRGLNIRICGNIPGPMVFGIFRPTLLLPGTDYDAVKLKMILSHEIVHIKRYDIAYKFFLMLVCAVHWFNPFVHIMSRKAGRDLEISCDSRALHGAGMEDKKRYSLMIIEFASQNFNGKLPSLFTSFGGGAGILEARIKNILSSSGRKEGYAALVFVLLIAVIYGNSVQIYNGAELSGPAAVTADAGVTGKAADAIYNIDNVIEKGNVSENGESNTGNKVNEGQPEPDETPGKNPDIEQNKDNPPAPNYGKQETAPQEAESLNENAQSQTAEIVVIDLNQLNGDEGSDNSSTE